MTITFSVSVKDKLLIKQGQDVDFATLLSKKGSEEQKIIPLSVLLKIPPEKIFLYLKKFVGEEVTRGELLAEKKSVLGKKQYLSEYEGLIKEIDHEKGNLVLTIQAETKQVLNAYFKGKIEDTKKNEITLIVKDMKRFELKEATTDFGGEVFFIDESSLGTVMPELVKNKVILVESIKPYNQSKLEVMGVIGFVSIQGLSDTTPPPFARIKNLDDWDQIKKLKLPYCLVDKKTAVIYFYQSL